MNERPVHTTFLLTTVSFYSPADCTEDVNCLKCGPLGCVKCPHPQLIEADTRKCVVDCARGYAAQWSSTPNYMGRVCRPSSSAAANAFFLTMVAVTFVALLSCALILSAIYFMKKRRKRRCLKSIRDKSMDENSVFLLQLGELRPNAEHFLNMLNDARRQIRKLHANGDAVAVQAYWPIVRDLAKILILVNKPVELIASPPEDWLRLFMWSQRILDRYKPQQRPLIDFLQASPTLLHGDPRLASCQHHTFKSTTTNSTNTSDSCGSLIVLQDFDVRSSVTLPRADQLGTSVSFKALASNRHSLNDVSALWLEDEFLNLGLRPQDEVTTEL